MATTYMRSFAPPGRVALVGRELAAGPVRFDLVWAADEGLWVDELKSSGDRMTAQLAVQCARQLNAGMARWGTTFRGVRVVWLSCGRGLLIGPVAAGACSQ